MTSRREWTTRRVRLQRRLAFAAAALWCGAVGGQTIPDPGAAEREFRLANELRATDMLAACRHFTRSMELDPSPTVLVRIAECHERDGKRRQALADYRRAQELNQELNRNRTQQQVALGREIERRVAELDAQTPKLILSVTPRPDGLELFLDGEALPPAALDGPVPIDRPGTHELVARAPGYQAASTSGDGNLSVVLLPLPEPQISPVVPPPAVLPIAPAPRAPPVRSAGVPSQTSPTSTRSSTWRIAGYATGATGLAALGVAAYFGIRTRALVNEADPYCYADGCDEPGYSRLVEATHTQTAGFIFLGVGAALTGIGAALVLTAPHGPAPSDRSAKIALTAGPLGATVRGTW